MDDLDGLRIYVGTYADRGGAGLYRLCHQAALGRSARHTQALRMLPSASIRRATIFTFCSTSSPKVGLASIAGTRTDGSRSRVYDPWGAPCHAALDPGEDWLAVANYGSGSTDLFRVAPDCGLIGDPAELRQNEGKGPLEERQDRPHAHCVVLSPDGKWLYQTDLGTDQILAFPVEPGRGALGKPRVALAAPPGSGPRHLVFHPRDPPAVLVSELSSSITVLGFRERVFSPRQALSTLPPDASAESLGGHLGTDASGDRIRVTNRGRDSIATFVWGKDGPLTPIDPPAGS